MQYALFAIQDNGKPDGVTTMMKTLRNALTLTTGASH